MYLEHFQLTAKPFGLSPNPKFLWLGEKHEEALAILKYGVTSDMGFLLMTGDVGVGKTALINRLTSNLDASTIFAHITDPGLGKFDFFRILAAEFKIPGEFNSKADFLLKLEKFLRCADADNRRVLLIVDEAQRLTDLMLDEIRVLSNIELSHRKLITIFFVGQPEFIDTITARKNRALQQRIAINYHIHPLTEEEVGQYIDHRLKVAGATRQIFLPDSFREIYRITDGFPRAINILCDHALVEGYVSGSTVIAADAVKACERELDLRAGLVMPTTKRQPLPASKPRPTAEPAPPRAPLPDPSPQKASKRTVWVVGVAVTVVVLAGYYWLRIKPNWNVRSAPQTTIAQSSPSSANRIAHQSMRPTSEAPDAVADVSASNSAGGQKRAVDPPVKKIASLPPPAQQLSDTPEGEGDASLAGSIGAAGIDDKTPALTPPPEDVDAQIAPATATEQLGSDGQPQAAESTPDAKNLDKTAPTGPEPGTIADATAVDIKAPVTPAKPPTRIQPDRTTGTTERTDVTAVDRQPEPTMTTDGSGSASTAVQTELLSPSPSNPVKQTIPSSAEAALAETATTAAETGKAPTTETPPPSVDDRAEAALAAATTTAAETEKALTTKTPAPSADDRAEAALAAEETTAAANEKTPMTEVAVSAPTPSDDRAQAAVAATTTTTAAAEQTRSALMEERVRSFLDSYTATYSAKDLERFTAFFADGATENGQSFTSMLPKYERNFKFIEAIEYRIELRDFSQEDDREIVKVEGDFFLRWLPPNQQWRENSGTIRMRLEKKGTSFLVQRLNYQGGGAKQN